MADQNVQVPVPANAGAAAAAAAAPANFNDREQLKVPLFHGDPAQDSFQAEYWIQRLQRLQNAFGWTNEQTLVNALNALRGRALHFSTFLEKTFRGQNATTSNWPLFKQEFLAAYGRQAKDTSSVANLHVQQAQNERVQDFGHRVVVTTDEFFAAMDPPDAVNYQHPAFQERPGWAAHAALPLTIQICSFVAQETAAAIAASLNKTIFLNGLHSNINAQVKNTTPVTFVEAYRNAMKIERHRQGPANHTIALEKTAKPTAQVNAIRRGGVSRGRGARNGTSRPDFSPRNGVSSSTNGKPMECWYCRKPGHVQGDCRKRIARGASYVSKPKSVAEITTDNLYYQDGSDVEEEDNNEDETDEYLNDALNEHVDALNIAALHLN